MIPSPLVGEGQGGGRSSRVPGRAYSPAPASAHPDHPLEWGVFVTKRLTVALAPHPSPLPGEREPVTCIGREFAAAASGLAGD